MKKFFSKKILIFFLCILLFSLFSPALVEASGAKQKFTTSLEKTAGSEGAGYSNNQLRQEPAVMIGRLVKTILALIGMLLLILLIYGGFIWMNSHGNETEVKRAQSIIQNALIGVVVVLMAYAITQLFFNLWFDSGVPNQTYEF